MPNEIIITDAARDQAQTAYIDAVEAKDDEATLREINAVKQVSSKPVEAYMALSATKTVSIPLVGVEWVIAQLAMDNNDFASAVRFAGIAFKCDANQARLIVNTIITAYKSA